MLGRGARRAPDTMEAMRRQGRGTRVARGAVGAAIATFVALLSHVTAGGAMPGWVGIAVPLALSFVVCTALVGRRPSLWRLAPAVGLSQVLFHTLFVLGGYDAPAGHVHGAATPLLSAAADPVVGVDATMWGWHLAAAAATTLALHRGERTLALVRSLADLLLLWLRARVAIIATGTGPVPRRRVFPAVVAAVAPRSLLLVTSARRRGPPLFAR